MEGLLEIPMFPLRWPFLPTDKVILQVFEPRYVALMREVESRPLEDTEGFGTVMIERGPEVGGGDARTNLGVLVSLKAIRWVSLHRATVLGEAKNVIEILTWREDDPFPRAVVEVQPWLTDGLDGPMAIAYSAACVAVNDLRMVAFEAGAALDPTAEVGTPVEGVSNSVWSLCAAAPLGEHDRYKLLAINDDTDRLRVLELMCKQRAETYRFGQD